MMGSMMARGAGIDERAGLKRKRDAKVVHAYVISGDGKLICGKRAALVDSTGHVIDITCKSCLYGLVDRHQKEANRLASMSRGHQDSAEKATARLRRLNGG